MMFTPPIQPSHPQNGVRIILLNTGAGPVRVDSRDIVQ